MWETVFGTVVGGVWLEIVKWIYRQQSQWLSWNRKNWREGQLDHHELQTHKDSGCFRFCILEILTRERKRPFQRRRQHL